MKTPTLLAAALLLIIVISAGPASALALGQVDTFEDGTTQGWITGLLGAPNPTPPVNEPTGGPGGAGDAYLHLSSSGNQGPGGRLTVINTSQWAGDYIDAGVGAIRMDLINLGSTDLSLRLLFANPQGGPPTDIAVSTQAVVLPVGGGWTTVYFPITPADLTALMGSSSVALSNATEFRLFYSPVVGFPGPPVAASLGVDNVQARADAVVPEPATSLLLATGLLTLIGFRKRQTRRG